MHAFLWSLPFTDDAIVVYGKTLKKSMQKQKRDIFLVCFFEVFPFTTLAVSVNSKTSKKSMQKNATFFFLVCLGLNRKVEKISCQWVVVQRESERTRAYFNATLLLVCTRKSLNKFCHCYTYLAAAWKNKLKVSALISFGYCSCSQTHFQHGCVYQDVW